MNNPERILRTLDSFLREKAELTLFGRAALALGFKNAPAEFEMTHDVDAILSLDWLAAPDENDLKDISFILCEDSHVDAAELKQAFMQARAPDVEEIGELFVAAQSKVLALAG
jgi:hypothetical protein